MKVRFLLAISSIILLQLLPHCSFEEKDSKFGKSYNKIRKKYGSPIIHGYMRLTTDNDGFKFWETPLSVQDTISIGYHSEKGFYINPDSILQEDDIFRKRISDSTFAFIGILTFGNIHKNSFSSIYYDTVCACFVLDKDCQETCDIGTFDNSKKISIEKADSILIAWGTNRLK